MKVTKISKTNTRGSKRRKCQKDDATNAYPFRDLLHLRLMQVAVLIVKAMMVPYLNNSIEKKIKNLASLTPHGGLPIEARFLC